jgi:hypothetical protein
MQFDDPDNKAGFLTRLRNLTRTHMGKKASCGTENEYPVTRRYQYVLSNYQNPETGDWCSWRGPCLVKTTAFPAVSYDSDFERGEEVYHPGRSKGECSAASGRKAENGERKMSDDLKVKAHKAVDDARVAAHSAYDDASVAAHNALTGKTSVKDTSDNVKIRVSDAVADAKIATHEVKSELKKR